MGVLSKRLRYREEGEQANVHNVESFGEPARSLFLSTDVIKVGMKTDITDGDGNVVYHSERKAVSIHDKTEIVDAVVAVLVALQHAIRYRKKRAGLAASGI